MTSLPHMQEIIYAKKILQFTSYDDINDEYKFDCKFHFINMTSSAALTGLRMERSKMAKFAHNLANNDTPGFKATYYDLATLQNDNGVHGYEAMNMDTKGALNYTGIATDLATDNNKGMFVVRDKVSGSTGSIITGSFRANADRQLEYLGQYLLMGVQYNKDGTLPPYDLHTLSPIVISDASSDAVASTNVQLELNLNSGILAKGKSNLVISPAIANVDSTAKFTGNLITDDNLKFGDGFAITIREEKNGIIDSSRVQCVFGGFMQSKDFSTATSIASSGAQDDTMNVIYNGVRKTIKRSEIASPGTSDTNVLNNLKTRLSTIGLNATVTTDSSNISKLVISPSDTNNGSLVVVDIAGTLASDLGLSNQNIMPVQEGTIRFGSMQNLADGLRVYFQDVVTCKDNNNSDSSSIVVEARNNTNITLDNLDATRNTLQFFGLKAGSVEGVGYDPYNSSANMALGRATPDMVQSTVLYNSKGGQLFITAALKKVSDGWIQELYTAPSNLTPPARDDGLLQVTKFTFDTKGYFRSAASVQPNVTSKESIVDPFAQLNGDVNINGQQFTYSDAPTTDNQFSSLAELVNAINRVSGASVNASIAVDNTGAYKLTLFSPQGTPINATGSLVDDPQPPLPDASQPLTINPSGGVDPLKVSFNLNMLKESEHKQMFGSISADGRPVGMLSSITIEPDGRLVGLYDNGSSLNMYKIPLARFKNYNKLDTSGNNIFTTTAASGQMQAVDAGSNGVGNIASGNIEGSNVDMAEQLTAIMQSKQGYAGSAKALSAQQSLTDILLKEM